MDGLRKTTAQARRKPDLEVRLRKDKIMSCAEDLPTRLPACLPACLTPSVVYRVALSFGMYELTWVAPAHARFSVKRAFMPYPFHEGVLLELLEKVWIHRVRVRGWQTDVLDSQYEISWE